MKQADPTPISPEQREVVVLWLQSKVDELPEELRAMATKLLEELASAKSSSQLKRAWLQIGRALRMIPSSEKRRSSRSVGGGRGGSRRKPATELERLEQEIEDTDKALDCDMAKRKKQQRKRRRLKRRLKKILEQGEQGTGDQTATSQSPEEADEPYIDENTPLDEIPLTEEEMQEIRESNRATTARMALGDGADPAFAPALETLMTASPVASYSEPIDVPAQLPADVDDSMVVHTMQENRIRYDLAFSVTELNLNVEKKVVEKAGQRQVFSGSTAAYGPARYSVTWGTLATLAVLIGQFAMPMNRLATLLSTAAKRFTTASLGRMAHYIGQRLSPIYLALSVDLTNAASFSGDDTSARVIQVSKYVKATSSHGDKKERPPWSKFASREAAEKTYRDWLKKKRAYEKAKEEGGRSVKMPAPKPLPLCVEIGRELTFEFDRRNGDGKKRSLNTTVVSGRSVPGNPKSQIVLYRSHLGSFGNLVEELLRKRSKEYRALTILSDLSTTNLVTDEELLSNFDITLAGCSAHARRPFALYESDDPIDAELMLSHFGILALHERSLTRIGRNRENVKAVRSTDSLKIWEDIKELAEEMKEKWSASTPLGQGCRYIIKNFKKLTAYLWNPILEWTNNLSERLLRPEKLIQKNSLFRQTLEGRVVLDIIRTVIQTACASGVPVHEYLVSVLTANPEDIAANPHDYTPFAWSKRNAVNKCSAESE